MITEEQVSDVRQSFNRCLIRNTGLISRFYEIFLDSHRAIPQKFANTDFKQQIRLLRHGIGHAIGYALSMARGERNLATDAIHRIRVSHCRQQLDIEPHLYSYWVSSLIQTMSENDPDWTEELERSWRQVMQVAVDHIKSGYEDPESA